MKKILGLVILLAAGITAVAPTTNAQELCAGTAKLCASYIVAPFVSDGQSYRALLIAGQDAEFHATFFKGTTYRIAGATGETEGNLTFSLYSYDPNTGQRDMIYTNSQHNNAPYWDFKVNSTVEVAITATLNPASGKESGCAVLLIGFKQ